jgi:hypothetical protein
MRNRLASSCAAGKLVVDNITVTSNHTHASSCAGVLHNSFLFIIENNHSGDGGYELEYHTNSRYSMYSIVPTHTKIVDHSRMSLGSLSLWNRVR